MAAEVNARLLVAYALLAIAVFANNGTFFAYPPLPLVALGAFIVLARSLTRPLVPGRRWLPALLLGSWALALARPPDVDRWSGGWLALPAVAF